MDINISVDGETAYLLESASIVCGNSNYVLRITFDTDWSAYTSKTAVFRYFSSGSFKKKSVLFQGNSVNVPALPTTNQVSVVFYAGDLHTTTPAIIPCIGETEQHDPPSSDVYNQLMEYLAGMQGGTPQVGRAVTVARGTMLTHVGQAQRATTVIDVMDYEWETGSGNINTGTFDNELTTRLRCNTFIPVPPARSSAILSAFANNAVGLESVIYWYAAASDASYLGYHAWAVNGTELPMPSTAQFFRLNLKIDNVTEMTPADLASCEIVFT